MVKKYITSALVGGVAVMVMGMNCFTMGYSETIYVKTLHAGDTIESVAEPFYELDEKGDSYMMFRHRVFERNEHLREGGRKAQPGDKILIPVLIKD